MLNRRAFILPWSMYLLLLLSFSLCTLARLSSESKRQSHDAARRLAVYYLLEGFALESHSKSSSFPKGLDSNALGSLETDLLRLSKGMSKAVPRFHSFKIHRQIGAIQNRCLLCCWGTWPEKVKVRSLYYVLPLKNCTPQKEEEKASE